MNKRPIGTGIGETTILTPCDYGVPIKSLQKWRDQLTEVENRRPLCIVSNWIYWDIEYSEKHNAALKEKNFLPAAIFSENLIWDEQKRWPPGYCVKSTWLQHFEFNCVFHTQNTSYLLVGPGTRYSISAETFKGLHF